ncbi:glycosyltransferase [Patescibacteria group bacterium]|nr:glycosyltransferase [Patescibacteria group bacterium]
MKIFYITTTVHISSDFNEAIGATTHTFSIAKELTKMGHEVFIISEKYPNEKEVEMIDGIKIYRLNRTVVGSAQSIKKTRARVLLRPLRIIPNTILAQHIAKLIRQEKADIIIERGHSRGVGAIASKLTGRPLVLETIDHIFSFMSERRAKAIIAYTNAFFQPAYKKKVKLVDAGFDPRYFYPVKQEKKYDVAYLGAFKEWDGLEDLVEVARRYRGIKFLLIGDGVRRERVEVLIQKYRLKNITITGKVPIEEVKNYLCQARIGVAPFNTKLSEKGEFKKYGFYFSPLKIFEYMACGLPVVSTDFPLIKKIITPECGELFSEGDVNELGEKIEKLLKNPKLGEISEHNKKYAQKYTWKEVAKDIASTF